MGIRTGQMAPNKKTDIPSVAFVVVVEPVCETFAGYGSREHTAQSTNHECLGLSETNIGASGVSRRWLTCQQ